MPKSDNSDKTEAKIPNKIKTKILIFQDKEKKNETFIRQRALKILYFKNKMITITNQEKEQTNRVEYLRGITPEEKAQIKRVLDMARK